jgi:hypothetical protein
LHFLRWGDLRRRMEDEVEIAEERRRRDARQLLRHATINCASFFRE